MGEDRRILERHSREVSLMAMMHHTGLVAYDPARSVDERFRAMMLLHYAIWGVTHTRSGSAGSLGRISRADVAEFARHCVAPGWTGVSRRADGAEVARVGALGTLPVTRRDESTGERLVEVPLWDLVWLTSALAAEFKLPDMKSGEPGAGSPAD